MNSTISSRISLIINNFSLTKNSFSKAIGLTNNVTIGRIVNEDRKPSYDIIEKILQTYGSINAKWLITGNGNMLIEPNRSYNNRDAEEVVDLNIIILNQTKEIFKLRKVIEQMRLEKKNSSSLSNQKE